MEDEGREQGPLFGDVALTIVPGDGILPAQSEDVSVSALSCVAPANRERSLSR